jgi:hypothetical protein
MSSGKFQLKTHKDCVLNFIRKDLPFCIYSEVPSQTDNPAYYYVLLQHRLLRKKADVSGEEPFLLASLYTDSISNASIAYLYSTTAPRKQKFRFVMYSEMIRDRRGFEL